MLLWERKRMAMMGDFQFLEDNHDHRIFRLS